MVTDDKLDLRNNGDREAEPETQEQLDAVHVNLSQLMRPDGALISMSKEQLSLMQAMFYTSTEAYREEQMWRMCDFVDEEEAADHVAAYYEAKELGMDTGFNVANMFALCSANRKGVKTNLMSQLMDTLQHGKWATAANKGSKNNATNTRSPLGG